MKRSQAPSVLAKARKASAVVSKASARATSITLKRELAPMVRDLVNRQTETKYYDEGLGTGTTYLAAEGATSGSSGHVLLFPTMPSAGTGVSNRLGNKINITAVYTKITLVSHTIGNINPGIGGDLYLVCWNEGGSFSIDDFLVADPTAGARITSRSMRNMSKISEFRVLAHKKFQEMPDNYQTQGNENRDYVLAWKGNLPVSFTTGSATALQNQLGFVFVANTGSVYAGSDLNCYVNSRIYFKDA